MKFAGDIPYFWNPFKILDINNFIRKFDDMSKQVCKLCFTEICSSLHSTAQALKC